MKPYTLTLAGTLIQADGSPFPHDAVDAGDINVAHLKPHVETWTLPKGEPVKVLIGYSCHCWTSQHDPAYHRGELRIMDGIRARVCDMVRLEASTELPGLIRSLDRHRIYVTASERNYGAYNTAFVAPDGLAYTAYFIIRQDKGRFDGVRHKLRLTVESAYHTVQPQQGSKVSLRAALSAGLHGRMVKYRR